MNRFLQRVRRHFSFKRPAPVYKPLVTTFGEFKDLQPHEMAEEQERELSKRELSKRERRNKSEFDVEDEYWARQLRSEEDYHTDSMRGKG